jgi:hypothetical protein
MTAADASALLVMMARREARGQRGKLPVKLPVKLPIFPVHRSCGGAN